ncbi:N-acetylmuramoyl-L-alanine amidase family protein [Paenibacillus sp. EPM92]|uniref:peptidoglycan recognition protein family protein n=1 Tax=Paenibacillus sp. EPM92 TaxID=1561195 RepID=UPI001915D56F|nr:peptidoglycan recognition family protein [Paenibacillus sp. EPM92]
MTFKQKYEITPRYLTGPSQRRPKAPLARCRFMVAHDTGNPGSTAAGNVSYYERTHADMEQSAHLFVDDKQIIECVPFLTGPAEKAWHVVYNVTTDNVRYGVDANDAAGGVELCYGGSIDLQEAYKRFVWVMAYSCYRYGLNPATDITGHYILDPARRTDPQNALRLLNKTFDDFVADVAKEYADCKEDEPVLNKEVANNIISSYLSPEWFKCDEQRTKAQQDGRAADAEAWRKLRDYQKYLADELRKASGQAVE